MRHTAILRKALRTITIVIPFMVQPLSAQIIFQGPKTIGRGWKDNIVLEARHFQSVQAGDVLTVYTDYARSNAQIAFQDPQTWNAIADQYKYMNVSGPARMTITADMLPTLRDRGIGIGGHDYRITYATLTPASAYQEKIVWKGPGVQMRDDWSASAYIPATCLQDLHVGQAIRFHVSKVRPSAAIKVSDFTWHPISRSIDGASLAGDSHTYYIDDDEPLLKLRLAGPGHQQALIVGGKGYRLDKIGIVTVSHDIQADTTYKVQQAPPEYILGPDELFHGQKDFTLDWRTNLRITAQKLQHATTDNALLVSYTILPQSAEQGKTPVISLRENSGDWPDLAGTKEPQWQPLDGTDYLVPLDDAMLDKVKTKGFVVTGMGFRLERIRLVSIE